MAEWQLYTNDKLAKKAQAQNGGTTSPNSTLDNASTTKEKHSKYWETVIALQEKVDSVMNYFKIDYTSSIFSSIYGTSSKV